jgi:hypothetical protein
MEEMQELKEQPGPIGGEKKMSGKKKAGVRWISWLFGGAILAAVALFAAQRM